MDEAQTRRAFPRVHLLWDPRKPAQEEHRLRGILASLPADTARGVAVHLRAKGAPIADLAHWAALLRKACDACGASLFVNGPDALRLGVHVDGVQCPESMTWTRGHGMPHQAGGAHVEGVHQAFLEGRRHQRQSPLGHEPWWSKSCHDARGLADASRAGVDAAFLSPVFAVEGKGAPLGVETWRAWASTVDMPVIALGGLRCAHASRMKAMGAYGVALISGCWQAPDPALVCRRFVEALC